MPPQKAASTRVSETRDPNGENSGYHLQKVNEELYKKNFELAVKNKTLSLLRKLYEITTLTLERERLARKLVYVIRKTLSLEFVCIFVYDDKNESVIPLAISTSSKTKNAFVNIEDDFARISILPSDADNYCWRSIKNRRLLKTPFFHKIVAPYISKNKAQKFQEGAGMRHMLLYPLRVEKKVLGNLVIGIDRNYSDLTTYEKESIDSLHAVVAIALDKAMVYEELKLANSHLKELDRAKSEFMSIASHQLRTPLAGIIGYLSMIEDGDFGEVNKEQQPIIHDVSQATQRLIRMVNIFLNVTRIEAGRFVMNYSKVPFADVIEAIYKELKPTADNKGVKLIYKKKALPEVDVDVDKIKDVILNLVDNAIKYSPKGRVEITAEANTRKVHVMVKDSGVGIEPEEAKNLFSKFVRGSGIARVEPNGSGLGLFIAKKITEGHGGKIWVESEGEGKGSTFQFTIPIKADKESKKKAEEFKQRAKGS